MSKTAAIRLDVKPDLIRWARERSRKSIEELTSKFPNYQEWEDQPTQLTYEQLNRFAKVTHTALSYLLLSEPPEENLPLPDFRTLKNQSLAHPSVELIDTVYLCLSRQDWYRDYAIAEDFASLNFIGSVGLDDKVELVANNIRQTVGLDQANREKYKTREEALKKTVDSVRSIGILVFISSCVGTNTSRKLNVEEFRGFALTDDLAPLVFVNGADAKSAQMFTLAHELAHLWLGKSALSNNAIDSTTSHEVEKWCDAVAAEVLVPVNELVSMVDTSTDFQSELTQCSKFFKVSKLVILRRLRDAKQLSSSEFKKYYQLELNNSNKATKGFGGDYYRNCRSRLGDDFVRNVIADTLGTRTSFTDAFRLLSISSVKAFDKLANQLGVTSIC